MLQIEVSTINIHLLDQLLALIEVGNHSIDGNNHKISKLRAVFKKEHDARERMFIMVIGGWSFLTGTRVASNGNCIR